MTTSRMSRRGFMHLASTVTGGMLLAACTPVGSSTSTDSGATAENVELSFAMYNFDPWLIALDDMYKVFMAENPGVTVKVESAPFDDFWPRQEAASPPAIPRI